MSYEAQRTNAFLVEPEKLKIITDPAHPLYDKRVELPLDENMVKNIMVHGVKVAINIKREGEDYIVVAGRQRVKSAIEANKRLKKEGKEPIKLRAFMEKGDEADMYGVLVLENELRHDDSPMSKAQKAAKLLSMGKTEAEVAVTFGCTTATIKNWCRLLEASPKVRKAVDDGKLTATAACKLAALKPEEQDEALEEVLSNGGGTVREVEHKVNKKKGKAKGSGRPTLKKVMKLRELLQDELKKMDKKMPAHEALSAVDEVLGWVISGESSEIVSEAFRK